MQTTWRLQELRAAIRHGFPQSSAQIIQLVDSIDRSTLLLRYHSHNARDALESFVDPHEPTGQKNLELVLGVSADQDEYAYAKLGQEAHLLGAIHTARGMLDIFGQLVNQLILKEAIPVHECSIQKAHQKIEPSGLKDALGDLLDSEQIKYITGFINTTKHRRLIQHEFSVSFQENRAGIRIGAFKFHGCLFPQRWGIELLQDANTIHNKLIDCGRALNVEYGISANV